MSEPLARGWATVDVDRATTEMEGTAAPGGAFEPANRSEVLGAQCLRRRTADGRGWIVVMEPDTEGRLAAFLARNGEGWAATWVVEDGPPKPGVSSASSTGPFGAERLEPGSPFGPFRLRVSPATIGR